MKWISVLLQIYLWQRNLQKSNEIFNIAQRQITKTKGYAISSLIVLFAVFFLLAAIITAVIELGLQINRGEAFSISGLIISAFIFFFLSISLFAASAIPFLLQKEPKTTPENPNNQADFIYSLAEEFLKQFTKTLKEHKTDQNKQEGNG